MADFNPTTTVTLYRATGVDALNQPLFTSTSAKLSWYAGYAYKTFQRYSYQREERRYIRVDAKADDLRGCDMLSYSNGGLTVFARILGVEFINPNCTEITFEVDRMQTFIEKIQWCECFIEREMQSNDWFGDEPTYNNTIPEGIETGIMTRTLDREATNRLQFTEFTMVVLSAYDRLGEPVYNTRTYNWLPTGLNMLVYDLSANEQVTSFNTLLRTYADKGIDLTKAIQGIYLVPSKYSPGTTWGEPISVDPKYPVIGNYRPANAKCFVSEFRRLEISNGRGESVQLKPENFSETDAPVLNVQSAFANGSGGVLVYPMGYEGRSQEFGVMLYNDVVCPFVSDAYSAWLASNRASLGVSMLESAIPNAINGYAAGGVGGMIAGGITGAAPTLAKVYDKSHDPSSIGGQSAGSAFQVQTANYGFSVSWVHPRYDCIRAIDEYFSRYGYRTNRLKKPNVDTRPKWNYVKTAGAVVKGPFDYQDKLAIQASLDNGVTFWHVPAASIGDYSDPMSNKE